MSGRDWRLFGRLHSKLWPKAEAYNPHWRDYASTVQRPIPLVILERVDV